MASERYNAPVREKHWQKVWEERGTFRASEPDRQVVTGLPSRSGRAAPALAESLLLPFARQLDRPR